jgi:DNA-binding CsgD family transcriptional regulator
MWRSNNLDGFLADMDGQDRGPAYRAAPPLDPGSRSRHLALSLVRPQPDDAEAPDFRRAPRRRSGHRAARSKALTDLASAAGALLDYLELAVVLLHPGGNVQLANTAACRIAARGDCFRIRARRLQMVDREGQAALEGFLNADTAVEVPRTGPRCLCRRGNGSCRYLVLVEWLDSSASPIQPLAALRIYEPFRVGRVSAEMLVPLYGLTPMESQLAAALYNAPRLGAAATRCGISLNTAKTHLKHVFSKCAVGSKAELMRLLALGPRSR